jgi:hypothetical protein
MINPSRRRRPLLAVFAAAMLLLAGGCDDDQAPLAPATGTCIVQGQLISPSPTGAVPFIQFRRSDGPYLTIGVDADATGRYRLEVPAGDYVISAQVGGMLCYATADGGVALSWVLADTLSLRSGDSPREINFRLGALQLVEDGLSDLDGWQVQADLYRVDEGPEHGWWGPLEEATVVDGRLDLALGAIVPGNYRIQVRVQRGWSERGESFWLPGERDVDDGDIFHVGVDSLTTVADFWEAPARLTGTVSGAWLAMGISAPSLEAYDMDNVMIAGPCQIHGDGRFELPFLRPVPVRLAIVHESARHWVGGPRHDDATVFDLAAGVTTSGVHEAISGVLVRTTLEMQESGSGSARLELWDPTSRVLVQSLYFQPQGLYGMACAQPGQYLARITSGSSNRTWRSQWYDRVATPEAASLVTIPANGGTLVLDLVLERGGVISGTIGQIGSNWHSASIRFTSEDSLTVIYGQYLGSTTEFSLAGLEDGRYKIGLRAYDVSGATQTEPGLIEYWYPGTDDWAAAGVIEISGANTVGGIVLTLP